MSVLTRFLPNVTNYVSRLSSFTVQPISRLHSLPNEGTLQLRPGGLFNISVRNIIRVHFPRPSERKRVKRHGWKTRMSTPSGRRVIMNRILKGRFVYTH